MAYLSSSTGTTLFAGLFVCAVLVFGCGGEETTTVTSTATETRTNTQTITQTETQTTTPAPTGGTPSLRRCGDVAFQPNSDSGAFDIRARGTDCQAARAVARAAEGERGGDYSASGFNCRGRAGGGELPSTDYTCTEGSARVTFSAS